MNPYYIVITACLVIIASYFFSLVSQKTNIPSVLMLIGLGIIIKYFAVWLGIKDFDLQPLLELLGIVGLILIVLEAALDLKITRDKKALITTSFLIAAGSLVVTSMLIATLFLFYFDLPFLNCLVYSIPLSITSSAIVIPSLSNMPIEKREFLTYESAFSDILGIIFFYSLIQAVGMDSAGAITGALFSNISLTLILSVLLSLILVYFFQNVTSDIRLFLLIAILILFYSLGKLFHLSSLVLVMVFGLMLENRNMLTNSRLSRFFKEDSIADIHKDLRLITIESSFTVRTFFFVIFGMTIVLSALFSYNVLFISGVIIILLFGFRYLVFRLFIKDNFFPEVLVAPRGLITLLLFYSMPDQFRASELNQPVMLLVIILSSLFMAYSLIRYRVLNPVENGKIKTLKPGIPVNAVSTENSAAKPEE